VEAIEIKISEIARVANSADSGPDPSIKDHVIGNLKWWQDQRFSP